MTTTTSPAARKREKLYEDICALYRKHTDRFEKRTQLYEFIRDELGSNINTVTKVLKANGLIAGRKSRKEA